MWITSHRSPFGPPFSPASPAFQADTLTIDYPAGIFTFSVFGVSLSIMPNTLYTGRL